MNEIETAWVAGLLEGEGSFLHQKVEGGKYNYLVVQCGMTDKDVIEKLQRITGAGTIREEWNQGSTKPLYRWRVYKQADSHRITNAVLPHLGERRSARALEVLSIVRKEAKADEVSRDELVCN